MENVEIDQETDRYMAHAHVGQQLRLMNRMKGFDGFHFYHDSMRHDQIDAISDLKFVAFIDGNGYFSRDFETAVSQFVRQAGLVGTFQRARAEKRMNLHRGIHNGAGDFVYA